MTDHKNGEFKEHCRYEPHDVQGSLVKLNENWERHLEQTEAKDQWFREYVDRSMPVKSHFWILFGSLTLISAFATAMAYIEKIN